MVEKNGQYQLHNFFEKIEKYSSTVPVSFLFQNFHNPPCQFPIPGSLSYYHHKLKNYLCMFLKILQFKKHAQAQRAVLQTKSVLLHLHVVSDVQKLLAKCNLKSEKHVVTNESTYIRKHVYPLGVPENFLVSTHKHPCFSTTENPMSPTVNRQLAQKTQRTCKTKGRANCGHVGYHF